MYLHMFLKMLILCLHYVNFKDVCLEVKHFLILLSVIFD